MIAARWPSLTIFLAIFMLSITFLMVLEPLLATEIPVKRKQSKKGSSNHSEDGQEGGENTFLRRQVRKIRFRKKKR